MLKGEDDLSLRGPPNVLSPLPNCNLVCRVFKWIEETFPHEGHRLLNHAIPATTSGYISACVPELVPPNTDLVILEFTYNDYVFSPSRTINNASRYPSPPPTHPPPSHLKTLEIFGIIRTTLKVGPLPCIFSSRTGRWEIPFGPALPSSCMLQVPPPTLGNLRIPQITCRDATSVL